MRILTILGARPQFIKHAIVQRSLRDFGIEELLLHTGQHFDPLMSQVFFEELGIAPPQIELHIPSAPPLIQLGKMLEGMQANLARENFDYVLVYGDTTSTLAGSLFAQELQIPLVHIEAGLRSGDLQMPEERNRLICDQLSSLLFVPTKGALNNLQRENVQGKIIVSGDVMLEGFLHFLPLAKKPSISLPKEFILCTLHRQSNVDSKERLSFLLEGLIKVSQKIPVVLPLHPRTKQRIEDFGLVIPPSIILLPPQGYLQNLWLLSQCLMVFTDSGGLQKEAYFANKKSLVLREVSEWVELVECGACELLGKRGVDEAFSSLSFESFPPFIYGEGKSVEMILNEFRG